jgi:hypothetical protein
MVKVAMRKIVTIPATPTRVKTIPSAPLLLRNEFAFETTDAAL